VVLERMTTLAALLQLPTDALALHWYEWDTLGYQLGSEYSNCTSEVSCGFDTHYPDYFPQRIGFQDTLLTLQVRQLLCFPLFSCL
jgi:hypothetical protein